MRAPHSIGRYAYPVSFSAHIVLLSLLLAVPRSRIIPPHPTSMSVELVKAPAAPIIQPATPAAAPPTSNVVPRIVPRLAPVPAVKIHLDPLPIPAQPQPVNDNPPIKITSESAPPVIAPPPDAVFDPGRPLSRQEPEYPEQAARRGLEGTVELHFTIKADGSTEDIHVVNSDPPGLFDAAALRSQRTARYKPATRDGKTVDQPNCRVIFHFQTPR